MPSEEFVHLSRRKVAALLNEGTNVRTKSRTESLTLNKNRIHTRKRIADYGGSFGFCTGDFFVGICRCKCKG